MGEWVDVLQNSLPALGRGLFFGVRPERREDHWAEWAVNLRPLQSCVMIAIDYFFSCYYLMLLSFYYYYWHFRSASIFLTQFPALGKGPFESAVPRKI